MPGRQNDGTAFPNRSGPAGILGAARFGIPFQENLRILGEIGDEIMFVMDGKVLYSLRDGGIRVGYISAAITAQRMPVHRAANQFSHLPCRAPETLIGFPHMFFGNTGRRMDENNTAARFQIGAQLIRPDLRDGILKPGGCIRGVDIVAFGDQERIILCEFFRRQNVFGGFDHIKRIPLAA